MIVIGMVSGVLVSGRLTRSTPDMVQVAWVTGLTEWRPASEVSPMTARTPGGEFPV
jgi:hypothetical protein